MNQINFAIQSYIATIHPTFSKGIGPFSQVHPERNNLGKFPWSAGAGASTCTCNLTSKVFANVVKCLKDKYCKPHISFRCKYLHLRIYLLHLFSIEETVPERRRLQEASKVSAAAADHDSDHYHCSLAYFGRFSFFA